MDKDRDSKRKKERHDDSDDYRRERRHKKRRSRSKSPNKRDDRDSRRKRRHSRSKSPNVPSKQDKRRDDAPKNVESKPEPPPRKAKETDMLNTRTGGAYIPPARLRLMQAQITDKASVAYQRLAWEALKKSIHGHINKINVGNIGIIIKELLKENIVRGRGLLCRSVIQAQAASPTFTNVYAALVSAVNSRFPNIGELLLKRLVIQFKRGFKRNDKPICISSASFIAHLVNQKVAHEILALELLTLLVETPTDDSVEVAIAFLKECGQKLTEVSSKGVNAIFEMLRNILHEGQLDKRVQYMIEVMFQVWKDGFKDHPAVIEELELVPEEEQFTHLLMLDDATDAQDILNVFKFDEKYEENEQKYKGLSKEILGSDAESSDEDGSGESGSEESDEEDEEEKEKAVTIIDNTETNLVALRRTIYLTINSSLDFEECAHKLMKMQLKPGQEIELCHMFLDCCAEQRTYEKFYGLLAQRFCNINRIYIGPFEEIFKDSYSTAHRLDTNRLRNVSKFFAHLLFTDSISWEALECVKLNEEDTTSSSRIYIKILFQELAEYMGLKKLNDRLKDPTLQEAFSGIFPRDNPKNTRFSINFFTSIGLGGLTDELREHLKQMPKNVPPQITEIKLGSDSESSSSSDSSSSSSSDSSDSSSSDSEQEKKKKEKKKKKKKDSKQKTPQPSEENKAPQINERWGHDGFYDTYGKDSGIESQTDRPNARSKDTDNFRKPREDFRNNDKRRYNDEQRNGNERNDRHPRDDRRGNQRDTEYENYRRRLDNDKRIRDEESSNRRRDDREERDEEYSRRRNDDRRDDRNREDDRRRNDDSRDDRNREDDRRRNDDRDYERSRNNRDNQFRDKRNDRELDTREKKNEGGSEYGRRRQERNDGKQDTRYEDNRRNRDNVEQMERGRDDLNRKERTDKERASEQNNRDRSDKEESRRKQDKDNDRRGRDKEDTRSKRPDERNKNNDNDNVEDSRPRVNSKQNDEMKRTSRNDYDRNKTRNQQINNEDNEERNRISKSKKDKNDERNRRKNKDSSPERKSESSDEEEPESKRRGKEKKREKNSKANQKESKSKNKEKRKNKEESESSESETSDSESSYEKKDKKSGKNKKREKERQKEKENIESDSGHSDKEQKDLGGRYWDNFDLESKNGSKEKFEGKTPERRERNYERRRER